MTFNASLKELKKHKTIDNYLFRAFTKQQLDLMYLDRKLSEAYKILSYCAITLWVLTEAEKQNELDWQVTETIKSFL